MLNLKTREDYEKFDHQIGVFLNKHTDSPVHYKILSAAFDNLGDRNDQQRLMASLVDIQITFSSMAIESVNVLGAWNTHLAHYHKPDDNEKPIPPLILEDPKHFQIKIDILRSAISFVTLSRALWDKSFGFMILLKKPDNYEKFVKSRSRKKAFRNIAESFENYPNSMQYWIIHNLQHFQYYKELVDLYYQNKFYPEPFLTILFDMLKELENIRTSEVHGAGQLRKYSLGEFSIEDSLDQMAVLRNWNISLSVMRSLENEFTPSDLKDLRTTPRYMNPKMIGREAK